MFIISYLGINYLRITTDGFQTLTNLIGFLPFSSLFQPFVVKLFSVCFNLFVSVDTYFP